MDCQEVRRREAQAARRFAAMEENLKYIFAVLVASLAACTSAPTVSPVSREEKVAAQFRFMECLTPHAIRLDDGKSDASTIALAMRGACSVEKEALYEIISRNESVEFKRTFRPDFERITEGSALKVVLATRKQHGASR